MKKLVSESLNESIFFNKELIEKIKAICHEETDWAHRVIGMWESGKLGYDKNNEIVYHKADGKLSLATQILDLIEK